MNERDDLRNFLPEDDIDRDQLTVDVPTPARSPYPDRIPSGYDPMGDIYLRGRASRGLAGGRIPWWVLLSGWGMLGGFALLILIPAIASGAYGLLISLVTLVIPLMILWRGTTAKLSVRKRRRQ